MSVLYHMRRDFSRVVEEGLSRHIQDQGLPGSYTQALSPPPACPDRRICLFHTPCTCGWYRAGHWPDSC